MKRYLIMLSVFLLVLSAAAGRDAVAEDVPANPVVSEAVVPPAVEPAVVDIAEKIEPVTEGEEGLMYTYGTVVSIAADSLVVNEYDFDSDSFKEITYALDPQVKFENMKAISDLVAGNSVEVYYVEVNGKKVAKNIGKDEEDQMDDLDNEDMVPVESIPAPEAVK